MSSNKTEITEVLKALNHEIRREIIRLLHEARHPIPYMHFMDSLKLPASSNVAYHLSLLVKAGLVTKDADGRYFLTDLGLRSALMLDLVSESKKSVFSELTLAFSRINPFEFLLGAWWLFFVILGLIFLSDQRFVVFSLLFISAGLSFVLLLVYRTRDIRSIVLLNNLIWIAFVPDHKLFLFFISLTNLIGLSLIFPQLEPSFAPDQIFLFIGLLLVFASIFLSFFYLYLSFGFVVPNFKRKSF
ncbi:MAG: ArsR/SmtB family transcription factor [Candidatus Hodarchaeales archaeon]